MAVVVRVVRPITVIVPISGVHEHKVRQAALVSFTAFCRWCPPSEFDSNKPRVNCILLHVKVLPSTINYLSMVHVLLTSFPIPHSQGIGNEVNNTLKVTGNEANGIEPALS